MGKGARGPAMPDPAKLASEQYKYNKQAALDAIKWNRINQYSPFGTTTWSKADKDDPSTWTEQTKLNPQFQRLLDSQTSLNQGVLDAGRGLLPQINQNFKSPFSYKGIQEATLNNRVGDLVNQGYNVQGSPFRGQLDRGFGLSGLSSAGLPKLELHSRVGNLLDKGYDTEGFDLTRAEDFSDEIDEVSKAVYDRSFNRINPEFERQRSALNTDLANRGIPLTARASFDARDRLGDTQTRSLNDLSLGADLAGRQEHQRLADLVSRNRAQLTGEENALADIAFKKLASEQATRGLLFNERAQAAGHNLNLRRQLAGEDSDLYNRGINEQNTLANLAFQKYAADQAGRQQGIQERQFQRQEPLNNFLALQGIPTPGMPQFTQFQPTQIQSPDYLGAATGLYSAAANAAARRAQGKGSSLSGLGSLAGNLFGSGGAASGAKAFFSDINLKENIEFIGTIEGLNLYEFNYKDDPNKEKVTGFLAQDLFDVKPEVVGQADNNMLYVRYNEVFN